MFTGFLLFWFFLFTSEVAYEEEVVHEEERVSQPRIYGVEVDNRRSGHDRCAALDCLCRVRPGATPDPIETVVASERRHAIYFSEGSSLFLNSQSGRISDASEISSDINSTSMTLIGYTDGCGTSAGNSNLARERISVVKRKILEILPRARIRTVVAGEGSIGHDPESRRVDIIVHTSRSVTTRIERIPADVYLIDASGSMWSQWRNWTDIVNISFEPGSRIYLSTSGRCSRNRTLDNIVPGGGTEIWYSYWKVLEYMSPGETLLIISDFDSDIPLTSSESETIRRKVLDRQITVKAVSL